MALRIASVVIATAAAVFAAVPASATPVEYVRLSRTGSVTTMEIELGCAMRYLDHSPAQSGIELRVRLELGQDCINALRNTPTARYRPAGSRLANLASLDFEATGRSEAMVVLRFERPVKFRLHQTANQYLLTLLVQETGAAPPSVPPPRAKLPTPPPDTAVVHRTPPGRTAQ